MTRRMKLYAALVAGAIALPAYAGDCLLPPPPSKIPDGTTASEQEMIVAMQTLKQYDGDVSVYLKCLDFEQRRNELSTADVEAKHNAAVAQLQTVAEKFNAQVRAFKSKHS